MRGHIRGVLADLVMRTDDGVLHYGVYIVWNRNEAGGAFHALCDFNQTFPDYVVGTIDMHKLRESGVRYAEHGNVGFPNCVECIVSMGDEWRPVSEKDVFA